MINILSPTHTRQQISNKAVIKYPATPETRRYTAL